MAFAVNSPHYMPFYATSGTTGIILSSLTVIVFTCNGTAVGSATRASLTLTEVGFGYYYASYTPKVAGKYVLALSSGAVKAIDVADIDDTEAAVNLTQNYGGTNALRPSLHGGLQSYGIAAYVLFIFSSKDWDLGKTAASNAVGSTELDSNGNWKTSTLTVVPGTYHVVIRHNSGINYVIQPYLVAAV